MPRIDMKLALQVVVVLLLHDCVIAQESRPPPGDVKPPEDGKEGDGNMLPPPEYEQPLRCYSNISCSDCEVRMGKCFPDKNQCCFEKPPHESCREGIPCDKCRQLNGTCGDEHDDECCFDKPDTQHPPMQCFSNMSCGDCEERMGRCIPDKNMCCFEKPQHFGCREDIPCDKCRELNGTCGDDDDDDCCFNNPGPGPEHPPMHCYNNLSCSECEAKQGRCFSDRNLCCFESPAHALCKEDIPCDKCKEMDGACDENGKCCLRKTGNMDKDDDMDESDEMDEDSHDNDDSKSEDRRKDGIDGYFVDHNGIKLRCIEKRCDPSKPKCGPKGVCLKSERKCCLRPTEKEAKSRCEMERKRLNEATRDSNDREAEHLNCTSDGSFLARCKVNKNECHCLNASSGQPVGGPISVQSKKYINCGDVQEQTKAARVNVTLKVTDRPLKSFRNSELEEMGSSAKEQIEAITPVTVEKYTVRNGSVYVEAQLVKCNSNCFSTANTSDLYSLVIEAVTQIEQGALVLNISGETFTASSPSITNVMSIAEVEALKDEEPETKKRDGPKAELIIIIVVAVAVVLVAVSLGVACYFYTKARHPKTKQEYFSDLTGHENPVYLKA